MESLEARTQEGLEGQSGGQLSIQDETSIQDEIKAEALYVVRETE